MFLELSPELEQSSSGTHTEQVGGRSGGSVRLGGRSVLLKNLGSVQMHPVVRFFKGLQCLQKACSTFIVV